MKLLKLEGFSQGHESVESIFNRLYLRKKLFDPCKGYPLLLEVQKLLDLTKELRVEKTENELGYYLPVQEASG